MIVQCCQRYFTGLTLSVVVHGTFLKAVIPKSILSLVCFTMPAHACTQLMDIPAALLPSILRHVPLQERLGVCTLVCHSFHAAAVAATHSISIMSMTQEQCDQLSEWLQRHGGGITALQAQGSSKRLLSLASLPCPLVRDLDLFHVTLQPGCFSACTSLTRLLLQSRDMQSSPHASSSADKNSLTQLSVLSSLQHLGLGMARSW